MSLFIFFLEPEITGFRSYLSFSKDKSKKNGIINMVLPGFLKLEISHRDSKIIVTLSF
jgi:hypothetical protein